MKELLGLFIALNCGSIANQLFAQKTPNIVLVNLDDAGNGDFSYFGAIGYKTPHIDQMASQGMFMTNFFSVQPVSGASRAGLLTGCYPNRIGIAHAPSPGSPIGISDKEETVAELLKRNGYATAIFGKWHLGDAKKFLPLQHGFDEFYGLPYSHDMWPNHPAIKTFPDLPLIEGNKVIDYNPSPDRLTTEYTEHAVDFIKRNKNNPFFLYLAHSMPHVPLGVSSKFKGKSEQGLFGDVMMEIDWSIQQLIETLKEEGLEENTLIILTSDNGPWANYGNHAGSSGGLREAKVTIFGGGLRVPCIFYWKGHIEGGQVCNDLASNIDIFATIVELSESPKPRLETDGISLLPVLLGEKAHFERKFLNLYYQKNDLQAVTDGYFKLVFPHRYNAYDGVLPSNDGKNGRVESKWITELELYDLRRDPGERTNVLSMYPAELEKLKAEADRCREELGDDLTNVKGSERRNPGRIDD